jgi:hypothetical protein
MNQPEAGEPSWDRKAAWLLWQAMDVADRALALAEDAATYEGPHQDPPGPVLTEDGY